MRQLIYSGIALALLGAGAPVDAALITYSTPGTYTYTILTTGAYTLTAYGAVGGSPSYYSDIGGLGAEASGTIYLTAGTVLDLLVASRGVSGLEATGGGGGGGSFIVEQSGMTFTPLLVAGGGAEAMELLGRRAPWSIPAPTGEAGVIRAGAGSTEVVAAVVTAAATAAPSTAVAAVVDRISAPTLLP